jgi:di/tricarboxylate transporter
MVGKTIRDSRIGEMVGLTVTGIIRGGRLMLGVESGKRIRAEDQLLVAGEVRRIRDLLALGEVQLKQDITGAGIESEDVGVAEVTLAPRSSVAGKTLAEIDFREKHGLQVLSIWRRGRPLHGNLARQALRLGDAFLVQGAWSRIRHLGTSPDYVVLTPAAQEARRTRKAPVALLGLLLMVGMVVTGFQPIHVAAFATATFVVLFGAITMEEAYRAVEWKAVFLVAAILPVGLAMERTGASRLIADSLVALAGPLGPYGVMAGMFSVSSLLSQCLDGAPAVVLMAPVVLQTAASLGLSPYPAMMGVSLAASAAFMTPFSHKANLIVMGSGGYRVIDYLKVGTPLTIILLGLMVWLVPVFFPIG